MRKVDVERDGGCLFRSIAVALFFQEYGISLGKGTKNGQEKTVLQLVHNIVSRWVRALVVHSMFYGTEVGMDTEINGASLRQIMDDGYILIECMGKRYRFKSAREARWNKRHFLPKFSYTGTTNEQFIYETGGLPLNIISLSGRYDKESHKCYCKRMASLYAWGGASEIYIISQITKYATTVYGANTKTVLQQYVPSKVNGVLHLVFLPDEEHYMALI